MSKATVFGAGSFGTALAAVLANNFDEVALWGRDAGALERLNATHENAAYLPGLPVPVNVRGVADLAAAAEGASIVVVATPAQASRAFLKDAAAVLPTHVPIVSAAKGIETDTLLTMTEVLEACLPEALHPHVAVLSGPSFAKEMMQRLPTVVTVASRFERTAAEAQRAFHSDFFRTYTSTDVVGVQIGGSLKNVIAIAAGMSDGLGLGHNARTAIVTRGLAEITRIAVRMGANPLTLSGLAGLGDLVLTCTGELSRNRALGISLGRGQRVDTFLRELHQVVEGVSTAKSARDLSAKLGVELPICQQVYEVAWEGKAPRAAAAALMSRAPKSELL